MLWYRLKGLRGVAYKRTLATDQRVAHVVVEVGFLSCYLNGSVLCVQCYITK